jgi:hypothetical protein
MCPIYLTGGLCYLAQGRRVSSHASKSSSRTLSENPGGRLPEIHLVGEVEKFGPNWRRLRFTRSQAVNDPLRPIKALSESEQEVVFDKVRRGIVRVLGFPR